MPHEKYYWLQKILLARYLKTYPKTDDNVPVTSQQINASVSSHSTHSISLFLYHPNSEDSAFMYTATGELKFHTIKLHCLKRINRRDYIMRSTHQMVNIPQQNNEIQ